MFQNLRRMLANGGTLKIACEDQGCGHKVVFSPNEAFRLLGVDATPHDVRRKLVCSRCGKPRPRVWI